MAETNPVVPPVVKEDTKVPTTAVPNAVLKDILDRMENYQVQISELKEAQKEYEQTASQDQILKIEKIRATGKWVKSIRLNYYNNNLVVEWKSTADDVYIDTTGKEIAIQKTMLTYESGKTEEVTQVDLARKKMQRQYEVIKEGRDTEGRMLYTVMMEGGKQLEIDSRFIN
jgi:Tfp pilus assembly protein PilX